MYIFQREDFSFYALLTTALPKGGGVLLSFLTPQRLRRGATRLCCAKTQ